MAQPLCLRLRHLASRDPAYDHKISKLMAGLYSRSNSSPSSHPLDHHPLATSTTRANPANAPPPEKSPAEEIE
uniref:Uncharacterized protein n=1 Tax=Leersia perrieri TaxID=77586 RepID=A0A0D9XC33_9ORYZ